MPPTFDEAVAQLTGAEAAGFDLSPTQAGKLLNQGISRLASRARSIKTEIDLGTTEAGEARYDLPDHVVDLETIRVGDTTTWRRTNERTFWALSVGQETLNPNLDGAFAPAFDSTGAGKQIALFPVPDADGLQITGLASITPENALAGTDVLPFPEEHWQAALDAAVALAYEQVDENQEQAAYYWQKFDTKAEELRRQVNSRVGSGPTFMKLRF